MSQSVRKPVNLSFDPALVAEARAEAWRAANAEAVASSNDGVAEKWLPLARHRLF
ncbi:MAG: post-segregation antitoxin CcdA [Gemmobacter sp.]